MFPKFSQAENYNSTKKKSGSKSLFREWAPNCSSEKLSFAGAYFILKLPSIKNNQALYSHAQGFVSLVINAPSITTFKASYFRIFTISDSNIVSKPMTKSDMMPTIKTKFPVLKILDKFS
jgi:hypothetical protein